MSGGGLEITQTSYNNDGKPASVSRWTGPNENTWLTTSYGYAANGAAAGVLSSKTEPNTAVTTYKNFVCNGMMPTTTLLPQIPGESFQMSTSQVWDTNNTCQGGVIASSTDVNGNTTTYDHNDPLWRLTQITRPDGGSTSYSYDTGSNYPWNTTVTTTVDTGVSTSTTAYYDGLNRVTEAATVEPYGGNDYVYTTYNTLGQVSTVSNPCRSCSSSGDPTYGLTTYAYDAINRVTQVTNPDNTFRTSTYSANAVETVDEAGITKIDLSDGMGRLTSVCEVTNQAQKSGNPFQPCGAFGQTGFLTTYTLSGLGQITNVQESQLQPRTFSYDALRRLTSETNPESGTTTYTYDYSSGSVNEKGDLYTRQRPAANGKSGTTTTTYTHDPWHRLTGVNYSDGTPTVGMYYDVAQSWEGTGPQNLKGNLTFAVAALGYASTAFGYNPMNQVNLEYQCTPQNCGESTIILNFGRNLVEDIKSMSDNAINESAGGASYTYTYDALSRLTNFSSNVSGALLTATGNAPYNALGELNSAALGNGIPRSLSYDKLGRPLTQNDGSNGSTYSYSLAYAGNGSVTAKNEAYDGSWVYGYDQFNRLVSSCREGSCPGSPAQAFSYNYDEYGNRWEQIVTGGANGPQPDYSFNNANNRITNAGIIYDAAGNETYDGTYTYSYDAEGRMTGVNGTSVTYTYDAFGHRVRKDVNGSTTDFVYDLAGRAIDAMNTTGGAWSQNWTNAYAGSTLVAENTNGTTYFYSTNWQGTVRVMTDPSQNIVAYCQNLPFGDGLNCTPAPPPVDFTGQILDSETNLTHFLYRQLSTGEGRWMTPDPGGIGAVNPANPQTWNRYAYVTDNPVSMTDTLGLDPNEGSGGSGSNANGCTANICVLVQMPTDAKATRVWVATPSYLDGLARFLWGEAHINTTPRTPIPPPMAELVTNMRARTTTFFATNKNGQLSLTQIVTRTDIATSARPGAGDPYTTDNIVGVSNRHAGQDAYGPAGAFIDTGDPRGRDIHGGGSGLPDPMAPYQGWVPTLGCTRGQNADVIGLGSTITSFQQANPDVAIPYVRE
ncbi:MAG TPA: RHS repeat-associated core domain-containing protein [Terriglobales bacterium]